MGTSVFESSSNLHPLLRVHFMDGSTEVRLCEHSFDVEFSAQMYRVTARDTTLEMKLCCYERHF